MSIEANKLLMMFIKDGYSSTGKITKKTALAMMRSVGSDSELQSLVNNGDNSGILKHNINLKTKGK